MNMLMSMTAMQTAGLYIGLLIILMLALKIYVGGQRAKLKVPSGDVSNVEFGRASRVQLNAVEDVPVLMVGLIALAALNLSAAYIHAAGALLLVARIFHAFGLSRPEGRSIFRALGTLGTMIAYLMIAGTLLYVAVKAAP